MIPAARSAARWLRQAAPSLEVSPASPQAEQLGRRAPNLPDRTNKYRRKGYSNNEKFSLVDSYGMTGRDVEKGNNRKCSTFATDLFKNFTRSH